MLQSTSCVDSLCVIRLHRTGALAGGPLYSVKLAVLIVILQVYKCVRCSDVIQVRVNMVRKAVGKDCSRSYKTHVPLTSAG